MMAGNESCGKTTKHIWFVIGCSEASSNWQWEVVASRVGSCGRIPNGSVAGRWLLATGVPKCSRSLILTWGARQWVFLFMSVRA